MSGADEEREAALRANDAFYQALAGGDYSAMESLWARIEGVLCIHPGAEPVRGREAVMRSWREILVSPPAVRFSEGHLEVVRGLAFVTGIETIEGQRLAATNVFVWEGGRWRLTHHQAGHVASPRPVATAGNDLVH
jgi:hypothetical protein